MTELVAIENLNVEFRTRNGVVQAVRDVSFTVARGETLGIVGESGSGKSVTSLALMRILDRAGVIAGGSLTFSGVDIGNASERTMRELRGREISMIFQNPRAALNPIRKVGRQIEDVLVEHLQATRSNAREKAIEMLDLVKIRDPEGRYHAYPFELSGGMCQRVVIAMALACQPRLLIADEPTTGLDVTTQKAVMDLVAELTRARGMSTVLITHDLGLAAAYCDRIIVMQSGKVVEMAPAARLFEAPEHPYTRRLMRATPRPGSDVRSLLPEDLEATRRREDALADAQPEKSVAPLLEVKDLVKVFSGDGGKHRTLLDRLLARNAEPEAEDEGFRAVDGISFRIDSGESVGLVGESGCGKSTTSAMIMRLMEPTSGKITLDGIDLTAMPIGPFARGPHRSKLQMVFQDPTDSLNPRFTAARAIADPILMLGSAQDRRSVRARVEELAGQVGLEAGLLDRFPHQLSGGQKARVGIARAIALNPRLLIHDEPTAALDVSVQAVVLNLLHDLRRKLGMSYLFVSHDLNVVRLLCNRVIVMRAGRIVDTGPTDEVMASPSHDYTRTLIEAVPHPPV